MRHDCANFQLGRHGGWATCVTCDGRLHESGCTSKRDKKKDCCPARHQMLADQGHAFGLVDSSVPMIGPKSEYPQG